ncbi:uncharacterized protein LOC123533563 isoform X2 [Mercenaria mercenaria]|uniref:uncharacterized protein LOC123533563 isoform X2 n=1 Tax=Mercenaria mercenaria TaxID=6596 RepID=UPI00234FB540|nr:uncharacterized protein LOC123533563 isoform X2 [Mercenaria mercenaria]
MGGVTSKDESAEEPTLIFPLDYSQPDLDEYRRKAGSYEQPDLDENRTMPRNFGQVFSERYLVPSDIENDPYALDVYMKALKDGEEEDRSIRVNVVGNFAQGKTSLVRRLVGESAEGVESTNGIDIDRYRCQKKTDGTFSYVKKETVDTSDIGKRLAAVACADAEHGGNSEIGNGADAQGAKESISAEFQIGSNPTEGMQTDWQEAQAIPLQDSITQPVDFISKTESRIPKHLMEEDFKIFTEQLRNRTNSNRETCNHVSFDIWDFGGQYTFYATHTIFHSRKAIYILVFNLSLDLKKQLGDDVSNEDESCLSSKERNPEYYIRFWMNSIHSFVGNGSGTEPRVILVGTHKDKLKGDKRTQQILADRYFRNIRDFFEGTHMINHIQPEDYAVDNTDETDASIKELREKIIEIGEENAKMVTIPAKWIQLEKQIILNRHRKIVSLKTVMEMDAESDFPIANSEQIKVFLKYHHNKGTLCYFDEEPISSDVVLDPQYLIDAFKCIITAEKFCEKDNEIRPFWQKLITEAKLEHALIDNIWGKDEDKEFMKHKETLLGFLKKHHIISEVRYDSTDQLLSGRNWFIVPSFLPDQSSESETVEFLTGKQQTQMRYILSFDSTAIVPTVYHRLMAAALGKWPVVRFRTIHLMYKDLTVFRLDTYNAGLLELTNETIELSAASLCTSVPVNAEVTDGFRRFVVSTVEHEFSKLRDAFEESKKPYLSKLRCNHPSHGFSGSVNLMEISQMENRKLLPCPDLMSHEIFTEMAMSEWFEDTECLKLTPKYELSDKHLSKMSRAIGDNWKLLGLELGLTEVDIQHIVDDNPQFVIMRIYKMLKEWSQKELEKGSTATIDVLLEAMKSCREVSIDWDIIRNVIDELENSSKVS